MKPTCLYYTLLSLALALCTHTGLAEEGSPQQESSARPLWEVGLFSGAARIPHYKGSDEYDTYVLPLPFLIYRGERLQSDREGVRGLLLRTDHFESTFSASGNPPVDHDNEAREDMPELDPYVEAGPALKWHIQGRQNPNPTFLSLALRGVLSVRDDSGIDFDYRGLHGVLKFVYLNRTLLENHQTTFGFAAALDASDARFNNYLYEVPEKFAVSGRPSFETDGGYAGFSVSANATKRLSDRFAVGLFGQWINMDGTAFENSPLVREKNNITVACALIWRVAESDRPAHPNGM